MKIEHFAINVADPVNMAAWYVEHLGLTVVRCGPAPIHMHFLADDGGRVMLEIYCNPPNEVPDYKSMPPLLLHLALVSEDPDADRARLEAAGATFHSEGRQDDGSHLVMMRDPWGFAIQLCKRGKPMLTS